MANYFSPIGNGVSFVDDNGNPRSGALLFTYIEATTTKTATKTDEAGSGNHTNPIVLNANGRPPSPIWLPEDIAYKFVLAPSTDTDPPASAIATWDNIAAINDIDAAAVTVNEWINGPTPTFISTTQFSLVGDQTTTFHVGRRIRSTSGVTILYGRISVSSFAALTTITVVLDSGVLDSGMSAVAYGIASAVNSSVPKDIPYDLSINGLEIGRGAGNIASNTSLGDTALDSNTSGTGNTSVGSAALTANTTGSDNTGIGQNALTANTTGIDNTGLGSSVLAANTTASDGTAVGKNALAANTTGAKNTAVGRSAAGSTTTGTLNTAVGYTALLANTTGNDNVAVGNTALSTNIAGIENVAIGSGALGTNTESGNTAVGHRALFSNTTAIENVAVGDRALQANTTGNENSAVGRHSLIANTTGTQNTALGVDTLGANTTGSYNTAVGGGALATSTTAGQNTAIGNGAMQVSTTAEQSTAVGVSALGGNTTGSFNVSVGYSAMVAATTAASCTAVGWKALNAITTTANSTAVGIDALLLSTGGTCTALGAEAGNTITTGANDTCVGYNAQASGATVSNEFTLGNASVGTLRCAQTTITAISDRRDKKDIQSLELGLAFVEKLKPVKFKWAMRDGTEKPDKFEAGFIAQDLQVAQAGVEWLGLVYESNPDRLEASPGKLIPILVNALQDLSLKNKELSARVDELERLRSASSLSDL